jgi:glycosyltransferase involved in cell wall biosynthesis
MSSAASEAIGNVERLPYRRLTAVVPVYNELAAINEVVRRIRSVELPLDLEVLLVDDGSTDGTARVLGTIEDSTVRVVRHRENQGKSAAIRTGIREARGDLILVTDADLRYDPQEWPSLLAPILSGKARVVFGSRYRGARETVPMTRWLADRSLSIFASVLFNTTISDLKSTVKVFDRSVLDGLELTGERFEFEPEVTAKLLRSGQKIFEVPVSYVGRAADEEKRITWQDRLQGAATLVRYRFSR